MKWRSIKTCYPCGSFSKKHPDRSEKVLVYSELDGGINICYFDHNSKAWFPDIGGYRYDVFNIDNVTHWMPLPAPPKDAQPGKKDKKQK